ncbi:MAG: hypothetical protein COB15_08160 [Flavobacteriales bacterium]|nr:MAG: hypothetical protein COB15_08160 [Flavobacteriales bacterium]
MIKKSLLLAFTLIIFSNISAQININNSAPYNNTTYLVNNVLSGNGVTASNITFTSANSNQIGFFNSGLLGTPNLGIDSGIVISSGDVNDIPIGGNQPDQGQYAGVGDTNLMAIAQTIRPNIVATADAAILEFDFTVTGDTFEFQFVFASEEYLTYVDTDFNDIFAFFLSGPGITGPYASPTGFPNGAVNVALIPGVSSPTPITISTIHPGLNNQFYINNSSGTNNDFNGFTTVITAKYPVICSGDYHFKFAIADAGGSLAFPDDYLDTGVFIKAGSLSSSGVSISSNTTTIIEGCQDATVTIQRSDLTFNDTINLAFSGNAIPSEYTSISSQHIFSPGATTLSFNVSAFVDNITEGIDTINIEIQGNTGCNMITLLIEDYTEMSITESDSLNICTKLGETALLWANVTNGRSPYSYFWDNGAGTGDTVTVAPEETTFYTPNVQDVCGNSITGEVVPVLVQCALIKTNIFTPNGDGINDFFTLFNLDDYPTAAVKIYNRWGKLVYENDAYENNWDGDNLETGAYFYIVTPNSNKFEYDGDATEELKYTVKGYVQLIR